VSVQGTGHGLLCDLADTVLVSTRRMNAVCVDPQTDTARARAGVR
jgi:FAD/FMN-containing dehydrogenase